MAETYLTVMSCNELRDFDLRGSFENQFNSRGKQPELVVIIEGIDQDLLMKRPLMKDGSGWSIMMMNPGNSWFIVNNDTDDHLQPSDDTFAIR